MKRVDSSGHVNNRWDNGDPGVPRVATELEESWHNSVQEELAHLVEGAGITLNGANEYQVQEGLNRLARGVAPGGRLTLSSGVSVSGDVAGAGAVYYTPHLHDWIQLYDGTRWLWRLFVETGQLLSDATKSPAAAAVDKVYDLFGWLDSGTFRVTRGPAWTSDTARGTGGGTTELEFFGGRWVNKIAITNGPAARRGLYLGSVRTDSGGATVTDTSDTPRRSVWNLFNRVERVWDRAYTPAPYTYTLATLRQVNAEANNAAYYLCGLDVGDLYQISVYHGARNTAAGVLVQTGVGIDGSTMIASYQRCPVTQVANLRVSASGDLQGRMALGWHSFTWLEASAATGTTTWEIDTIPGGMNGRCWG